MEDAAHEHRYFVDVEIGEVILISDWSDDDEAREDLTKIEEAEPDDISRFHVPNRAKATQTCRNSSIQSATSDYESCSTSRLRAAAHFVVSKMC